MLAGAYFTVQEISVPQLCSLYNSVLLMDLNIEYIYFFKILHVLTKKL